MNEFIDFFKENKNEILVGITILFIGWLAKYISTKTKIKFIPKDINQLLNNKDKESINWKMDLIKSLKIKDVMKEYFPEYKDFILIQYGSSVNVNNTLPNDYDFIVLMLGYPKHHVRSMHNKGTKSDVSNSENKTDIDIVFRDYLSFLFAASAGMPYENSIIKNGKLIVGHEGYFQWLKNITKNILIDRDFLIKRFHDKIYIEKEEFLKCLNEHKNFNHDKYYVVRSGYYYITSLLQLKKIQSYSKVITQNDVVTLANVKNFYNYFNNEDIKNKYILLVENLKRNKNIEDININDINSILSYILDI